jgi:hypothetical protein
VAEGQGGGAHPQRVRQVLGRVGPAALQHGSSASCPIPTGRGGCCSAAR